jgi:hypothetical protein
MISSPTKFGTVLNTGKGGMQFSVSGTQNYDEKWKKFSTEFVRNAKQVLEEQGSALCHEMARYSLPTRANTALTANNALAVYAQENAALANVAFKPWESKGAIFWLMSPYSSVADYVVKSTNFKFTSNTAQNLFNIGNFDLLRNFLMKKGFTVPRNIPEPNFVVNQAELGTFINWKSQYKKASGPKRGPYYVKNKASISKMANEKSLYNYASIVINGWLAAGRDLGNKLPSGIRPVTWPHGKGLGSGRAQMQKNGENGYTMTISNRYYNLNGIFNSSIQQTIWKNRNSIMDREVQVMFQKMTKYYDSLP